MIIGIPKERKNLEKRIALTPDGAHQLVQNGHRVLVEEGAGHGCHLEDESYRSVGAEIVPTLADVWQKSQLVVKVKEPHEEEYQFFRDDLVLFDYLHLASMPDVAQKMIDGGVIGIAYELVQNDDGSLPLLEPMSEVAGKLSILNAAYFLFSQNGGRGILPGGVLGTPRAHVVIVGAGIAGRNACEMALGLGAQVTILDINHAALERVKIEFGNQVSTLYSTPSALLRACSTADILVGAVLIPGAAAPKIISREMIQSMPKGAVFVDISIDQGGCAETIRATSLSHPIYVEEDVVHYGVCNVPAQTARTSTMALTSATLPYIVEIANLGIEKALSENKKIRKALNTFRGKLTNKAVSEAVRIPFTPIEEAVRF